MGRAPSPGSSRPVGKKLSGLLRPHQCLRFMRGAVVRRGSQAFAFSMSRRPVRRQFSSVPRSVGWCHNPHRAGEAVKLHRPITAPRRHHGRAASMAPALCCPPACGQDQETRPLCAHQLYAVNRLILIVKLLLVTCR